MVTPRQPIALILAAGFSRRFGRDKRRVKLHGGRTLLEETLSRIRAANLDPRLVLRADDDCDDFGAAVIRVPAGEAGRGLGASLAAAAAQLDDDQPCLVCLGDMPFIQPRTYAAIAAALGPGAIVVPCHQGRRGNPVAFAADYLPELRALDGDRGARALLERDAGRVVELALDDPGIHRDIDTVADLLQV